MSRYCEGRSRWRRAISPLWSGRRFPIRAADPLGAIGAYWRETHHATVEELATLQALADAADAALARLSR